MSLLDNKYKHKYLKYKSKYLNLLGENNTNNINTNTNKIHTNKIHTNTHTQDKTKSKILGTLLGCCVGDALGTRYEFSKSETATKQIQEDMTNNYLPILGDGPFKAEPGQISDDAEMTLSLLRSIIENTGYSQEEVAQKYISWFNSNPIDVGNTIKRSLRTRKVSQDNLEMIKNSEELNSSSLSNGVLMRASPLGILGIYINSHELKNIIDQECNLTHPHPIIKDAVFIYCLAIKYSILGFTKKDIYNKLLKKVTEPRVKIILKDSQDSPYPAYLIDETIKEMYVCPDSKRYQGYFGIALQIALYELFNSTDFDKSLIQVVKLGGDTDTNSAITGALLGAYYGLDKINKDWIKSVTTQDISRIKKYPEYSPNIIFNLVEKLLENMGDKHHPN